MESTVCIDAARRDQQPDQFRHHGKGPPQLAHRGTRLTAHDGNGNAPLVESTTISIQSLCFLI
jgi:hypothetical protein